MSICICYHDIDKKKKGAGENAGCGNPRKHAEVYENYKEQMNRLKKAMANAFYLEALFIEYAIMEDRAEAILRYEGNEINAKNGFVSIDRKLNKILKIAEQKKSLLIWIVFQSRNELKKTMFP